MQRKIGNNIFTSSMETDIMFFFLCCREREMTRMVLSSYWLISMVISHIRNTIGKYRRVVLFMRSDTSGNHVTTWYGWRHERIMGRVIKHQQEHVCCNKTTCESTWMKSTRKTTHTWRSVSFCFTKFAILIIKPWKTRMHSNEWNHDRSKFIELSSIECSLWGFLYKLSNVSYLKITI